MLEELEELEALEEQEEMEEQEEREELEEREEQAEMEEQEARLIQGVLNLSEDEVRQITRFRRGEGLLCIGYNHVPVQFHATEKEYDAITTSPTDLRTRRKEGGK